MIGEQKMENNEHLDKYKEIVKEENKKTSHNSADGDIVMEQDIPDPSKLDLTQYRSEIGDAVNVVRMTLEYMRQGRPYNEAHPLAIFDYIEQKGMPNIMNNRNTEVRRKLEYIILGGESIFDYTLNDLGIGELTGAKPLGVKAQELAMRAWQAGHDSLKTKETTINIWKLKKTHKPSRSAGWEQPRSSSMNYAIAIGKGNEIPKEMQSPLKSGPDYIKQQQLLPALWSTAKTNRNLTNRTVYYANPDSLLPNTKIEFIIKACGAEPAFVKEDN